MPGLSNTREERSGGPSRARVIGFLSPGPGSGRTGMLATTATVLAAGGRRVLLLDGYHQRITLHNYFWPFHLVPAGLPESAGRQASLRPPVPVDQLAHGVPPVHYGLPMGLGDLDLHRIAADTLGTSENAATELRRDLAAMPYDYVLIDYPAETGEGFEAHLAALCDVAVLCYTPRQIDQAAGILGRLQARRSGDSPRIVTVGAVPAPDVDSRWVHLPTPHGVRTGTPLPAEPPSNFGEPPDAAVEVRLKGYQMAGIDQVLPLLLETREELAPYARLAEAVTEGAVGLPEIPSLIRTRYQEMFGFRVPGMQSVSLLYAPEDRGSADWLAGLLRRGGITVEKFEPGQATAGGTVCVISSAALGSATMRPILRRMTTGADDLVWIKVGDDGPPPTRRPRLTVDLTEPLTWTPSSIIRARFGLIELAEERAGGEPRFPAAASVQTMSLPARNPAFVGREDLLNDLRSRLISDSDEHVFFGGGPGIGKSEVVREYAYRFAYDYDIVWWIPAQTARSALAALTALADRMSIKNRADAPRAAVEALGRPDAPRSLLIYDNADDPEELDGLVPRGPACHVLVTSRRADADQQVWTVGAFAGAESVAMLTKRVPTLPDDLAGQIAEAAHQHPLALRMVSAWLRESIPIRRRNGNLTELVATSELAGEVITRLRAEDRTFPAELLSSPEMTTIARSLAMVLNSMGVVRLHLTVRLAELAAFLSPDGASLDLLRAGPILRLLADEKVAVPDEKQGHVAEPSAIVADEGYIDVVLWSGTRYGLFEVDWGWRGQVRIHRAVQELLKARMNGDRGQRRDQIQHALAAYAPSDPQVEEPAHAARMAELQRHFDYCEATGSDKEPVRHWVNKQVRYLYRLRDRINWQAALRIAETAADAWQAQGLTLDDAQLFRLRGQVANLYRALGDNARARKIDEELLAASDPGADQPPTLWMLRVRRGLAGDLRGDGAFIDAWEHDKLVQEGLLALLGRDHLDTLMSQHNLAISQFLAGFPLQALTTEQQVYKAYLRLMGRSELGVWRTLCNIGIYQRELGLLDESLSTLQEAAIGIRRVPGLDNRNHVDVLRIRRAIEVTRRCLSEPGFTAADIEEISDNYVEVLNADHPYTVACRLSLAAAYGVEGRADLAVSTATACLEVYRRIHTAGHPFQAAALANLAMYRRQLGDSAGAYQSAWQGHDSLNDRFGVDHQWTIAAAVNLAACQYSDRQTDDARSLLSSTAGVSHGRLGETHPYTRAARTNLTLLEKGAPPSEWVTLDIDIPQT
ncbi:FxSxx-COOH system tetratricopeptide repeat protein [Actinoplanes sp. NPDC049802]|uniref:FxSxx-COOH system tetratricopeptide repeat protein n=1 Tax=Actinoplanes sp. NPDC049802 TaxID=3154742 RepID=UPI0033C72656